MYVYGQPQETFIFLQILSYIKYQKCVTDFYFKDAKNKVLNGRVDLIVQPQMGTKRRKPEVQNKESNEETTPIYFPRRLGNSQMIKKKESEVMIERTWYLKTKSDKLT